MDKKIALPETRFKVDRLAGKKDKAKWVEVPGGFPVRELAELYASRFFNPGRARVRDRVEHPTIKDMK